MKGLPLPFQPSSGLATLIRDIELTTREEILVREGDFNKFDAPASAQGGFDSWVPHVTINRRLRDQLDEHGFAHELLHIKRFCEGAFSLETPERVAGIVGGEAEVRKAFANDITNQIEHIAIFPELEKLGFNPHDQVEEWKQRQIEKFERPQKKPGPLDQSWLAMKIGVSPFLGKSPERQQAYRHAIGLASPEALKRGDEVSQVIERFGVTKIYNLKRLYQLALRAAGVPKRALLLKQFDIRRKGETLDPIP